MSQAVVLDQVSKRFGNPSPAAVQPQWKRLARQGEKLPATPADLAAVGLDQVSFTVETGEIFGVVGPSGSGKSTLIRLLAGLLVPDSGSVQVFGFDPVRQAGQVKRLMNPVSGQASFFRNRSVLENLLPVMRGSSSEAILRHHLAEAFDILRLPRQLMDQPMENLTRQELQQVTIARSVLSCPQFLLLDDPTRGLDPDSHCPVYELLENLREAYGTTILVTLPGIRESEQVCDRIAVLHSGRLVALGMPYTIQRFLPAGGGQFALEDLFSTALAG